MQVGEEREKEKKRGGGGEGGRLRFRPYRCYPNET